MFSIKLFLSIFSPKLVVHISLKYISIGRVAILEKTGVIKEYSLVVDPTKNGFGSVALIGVDAAPEKYLDVAKKLTEFDGIKYAASTTGDHMFMLEVWAKNDEQLRVFSDKLKELDGVTRICPAIIKDALKGSL